MMRLLAFTTVGLFLFCTSASINNPCAQGGKYFHKNDACYEFVSQSMSWTDAKQHCRRRNGHLASVTSPDTQMFLEEKMTTNMSYWIGAMVRKRWLWENGDELTYFDWFKGEPASVNGKTEDHIMMWAGENLDNRKPDLLKIYAGYQWNDEDGMRRDTSGVMSKFICEIESQCADLLGSSCNPTEHRCVQIGSKCYYFGGEYKALNDRGHYGGVTWTQGKASCKTYFGATASLARVTDGTIQNALTSAIKKDPNLQGNYWIGATWDRISTIWLWDTEERVNYTNWYPGQPSNDHKAHCAAMKYGTKESSSNQFKWIEDTCSVQKAFICQYDFHCGHPPRGQNTYWTGRNHDTFHSKVTYKCYTGYSVAENSSLTVECLGNGQWSSHPVCFPIPTKSESTIQTTPPKSTETTTIQTTPKSTETTAIQTTSTETTIIQTTPKSTGTMAIQTTPTSTETTTIQTTPTSTETTTIQTTPTSTETTTIPTPTEIMTTHVTTASTNGTFPTTSTETVQTTTDNTFINSTTNSKTPLTYSPHITSATDSAVRNTRTTDSPTTVPVIEGHTGVASNGGQTGMALISGQTSVTSIGGQIAITTSGGHFAITITDDRSGMTISGGETVVILSGGQTTVKSSGDQTGVTSRGGQTVLTIGESQTTITSSGGQIGVTSNGSQDAMTISGGQTQMAFIGGHIRVSNSGGPTTVTSG